MRYLLLAISFVFFTHADAEARSRRLNYRFRAPTSECLGFGSSVAANETMVVIGAPYQMVNNQKAAGAVYIYILKGSQPKSKVLTATVPGHLAYFGDNVAIYNNKIYVTASGEDERRGSVYIFEQDKDTSKWVGERLTITPNLGYKFGGCIDVDEKQFAVGAHARGSGGVVVYNLVNGSLTSQLLYQDDIEIGAALGVSVGIEEDLLVAGAPAKLIDGKKLGGAYIYRRNNATNSWEMKGFLTAKDNTEKGYFGHSVALLGDKIVVGAPNKDNEYGAVYIYDWAENTSTWNEEKLSPSIKFPYMHFGNNVLLSDKYLIVAASRYEHVGAVFVYKLNNLKRPLLIQTKKQNKQSYFGDNMNLVGDNLYIGASAGFTVGDAYVCNLSQPSRTIFKFKRK